MIWNCVKYQFLFQCLYIMLLLPFETIACVSKLKRVIMTTEFIPLSNYQKNSDEEMNNLSETFFQLMKTRRTVRDFSTDDVSTKVIDNCIATAGRAPSGANQQPWHFVVVRDKEIKKAIRLAAEEEERKFYAGRAGEVWLDTLEHLGTDEHKPFLENAPVLIAIFEQKYSLSPDGEKVKHYYSKESTGIATGLLITAIHNAGLVSLTHTPSPMNFLRKILKRPEGERPFLLLVVGHPAENTTVPDIQKKSLDTIRSEF